MGIKIQLLREAVEHFCTVVVSYPWNPAVGLLVGFCFKWGFSNQELVAKDPETPQVHFLVMSFPLDHLWRQVVQCPTQSGPPEEKRKKMFVSFKSCTISYLCRLNHFHSFTFNLNVIKSKKVAWTYLEDGVWTDQPKSAILSSPLAPSNRFSGLMSLWITFLVWQ